MATTTTTITNTGGIANSLNTLARADEDDVSVDCGTIGSSNEEEYIQVYRERILVGGSYFPPDNSESGSDRSEWNGMLHDISSLFPATKSETDSSSLFSSPNSNSIKAIFPPHRSIDDNGMQHDISSLFPATKSETDSSSLFSRPNSNSNSIMAIFSPHRSTDGSENYEKIIAQNPSISSYFPAYFSDTASLDRAYSAIQDAMYWPEDEFRLVLNRSTLWKSLWFSKYLLSLDDNASVDLIDPKAVVELRVFTARLIHSGFKKECIQVYSTVCREALDNCLVILGIEKLSIEEVQKIEWNSLDEKINKWIQAVKTVVGSILSGEKSLCDQIFYGDDETKEICFNEIVKGCMMQLLNFGEAVAIGRRSPKKVFRILDMHDVMVEALARLKVLVTDDVVINKVRYVLFGLCEAACGTFIELENVVLSETSKKPMQSGEIHLLIRYVMNCVKKPTLRGEIHPLTWHMRNCMKLIVMNYVKLIVDYSETLNFMLEIREDERGPSLDYNASVDLIDPKAVDELREITTTMIRSGFKKECIQFYNTARSDTLDECLVILGIEKLSIEEVQKIECNSLNEKMKKWIQAVKIVVRLILRVEKSLSDQIFCGANETKEICFNETVKGCVMQLLNFGEAVAIGGRSPEKLFRILGMYDVMADALKRLEVLGTDDVVINKARDVLSRLGEAACGTFAEFENAVQSETLKEPMQSGEIHPLMRYVMDNVKLIVDYSDTLNFLLEIREDDDQLETLRNDDSDSLKLTPVARRLLVLITSLHSNLEEKSKLYEDGPLRYIFLMNNILYVVQKVKDSDLGGLFGNNWVRERRGQMRIYAWNYFWASWTKVSHCLKDDEIGGSSSNASRVALEEKIKNFNTYFEEIYRVQTAWKVPDAKLRKELRIFISKKVIPDYRSFMGRFGNQAESGRHTGNYMKYTADDLENYLLDLFEGSPRVLHAEKKYIG